MEPIECIQPESWLFPVNERMPFAPAVLEDMKPYIAPNTLETWEEEEAAMRILWPSICLRNQWFGVELHMLCQILAGWVEIEHPSQNIGEIARLEGWQTVRKIYDLSQKQLLHIGGPSHAFVVYPTPKLVDIFGRKALDAP